ncbi:MAG: hypothetical protein ACP5KZ_09320 [bacterium]
MKRSLIILFFFFNPLCWSMLSVEEAAQAIRQFEGIPDLRLKYLGLNTELTEEEKIREFLTDIRWPYYCFETDYPDKQFERDYAVEPYTGQIILWLEKKDTEPCVAEPFSPDVSGMLTPEELYNRSVSFIQQRICPNFNPSQYDVVFCYFKGGVSSSGGEWTESGHFLYDPSHPCSWPADILYQPYAHIEFIHHVTDGFGDEISDYSSSFSISIGVHTGNIHGFCGYHFPISISLTPSITREQAKQIALSVVLSQTPANWFALIEEEDKFVDLNYDLPPNCAGFYWRFYIEVFNEMQVPQYGYGVTIDGHSGEVVFVGKALGRPKKKFEAEKFAEFKKIAEEARKLKVEQLWSVIEGDLKKFLAKRIGRKFYLRLNQTWYFCISAKEEGEDVVLKYKSGTFRLGPRDVVRKDGKVYVPLGVVLEIAGYEAKYVPKEKAIYIQKKDNRKEKTHGAIGGGLSISALSYVFWKFFKILA